MILTTMPTETALLAGLTDSAPTLALTLVAFIGGVMVPFPYAMERFRGFGRTLLSKLPYTPPAGMDAGEALEQATAPDVETGGPKNDDGATDSTDAGASTSTSTQTVTSSGE